jgi:hypothetical protein
MLISEIITIIEDDSPAEVRKGRRCTNYMIHRPFNLLAVTRSHVPKHKLRLAKMRT